MPDPIRASQIKIVFPAAADDYLEQIAAELNTRPAIFGLDTPLRRAHFFAQMRQESGPALEAASESLEYSPEALIKTFDYYRRRPAEAQQDGYALDPVTRKIRRPAAQERIANNVYADRNGNGAYASGDGWQYRGRGFVQVTGRANYSAIAAQCRTLYPGMDVDFLDEPEAIGTFPGAVHSAVGYWILNKLHQLADRGATDADVDRITAVINRNTDSYAQRRAYFSTAVSAFFD